MFDDKHNIEDTDTLLRSILSQAEEEVPERVWEGISKELDRIDRVNARRPVVLWFRRSAIAAAAAAAVAVGVFMNRGDSGDFVPAPAGSDMIAVVEKTPAAPVLEEVQTEITEEVSAEVSRNATPALLADAEDEVAEARQIIEEVKPVEVSVPQQSDDVDATVTSEKTEPVKETVSQNDLFPEEWPEDETVSGNGKQGVKTAIVLSGITGTNNSQNKAGGAFGRQPTISTAPPKTGIKETSNESTYGLPLSAGLGVKLDFTPKWSLGIGVNYSLLTRRFYGSYTEVSQTGVIDKSISSDIRNSQQYIGIPVNVYYNVLDSEHMNFYAYAGGTAEKCISDKYDLIGTEVVYTEKVKGVQLSANVGIGVEFLLGQHLGLYIDPSLRYYFSNGQPKSIRTAQPLMLGFEMGLRVRL